MVAASRRPAADGMSAMFDVFVLAHGVQELLRDAFAGAPLTPDEYAIYSQLFMNPHCTLSELATALAAPLTTVSDWIRTFDQRGHIRREVRPADRRSCGLALTEAGLRAQRETNLRFERANDAFIDALAQPEPELRRVLQQAVRAVTEARDELAGEANESAS